MSITVNTNMSSLICQRSLTKATSGMNTALQRMSTGLKINSAKDDAAGCAISSKMDYKLSSYSVAQDNAQMGQSMLDTASGSLSVMNNMLQRMRDLSEQAANGTYGKEERQAMQAEVSALTDEIYRIKNSTEFNGKKVLGEETVHRITEAQAIADGFTVVKTAQELKDVFYDDNWDLKDSGKTTKVMLFADIDLNELKVDDKNNWVAIRDYKGIFDGNGFTIENLKINKSGEDYQGFFGYTNNATIQNVTLENIDIVGCSYTGGIVGNISGTTVENCFVSGKLKASGNFAGGIAGANWDNIKNCSSNMIINAPYCNQVGGIVGANRGTVTNCYSEGTISGNKEVGGVIGDSSTKNITNCSTTANVFGNENVGAFAGKLKVDLDTNAGNVYYSSINPGKGAVGTGNTQGITDKITPSKAIRKINSVNLQVGINADSNSVISVDSGFEMGDFKISLNTEGGARIALDKIDAMMAKVNAKQLDIGATSNRLASTMEFQEVQMSALTSANSLIKDADIAKESASYIKNQILQQTTATLLATANQNPSIALSLV